MIQNLNIGEVIRINGREYVLTETEIGGYPDKKRVNLILLKTLLSKDWIKHQEAIKEMKRGIKNGNK